MSPFLTGLCVLAGKILWYAFFVNLGLHAVSLIGDPDSAIE
jgi:hypothetical protein